MTEDDALTEGQHPLPSFLASVTAVLLPALDRNQTVEDALTRIALRYREENPVEGADSHEPAAWSFSEEAKVRLQALLILEETLAGVERAGFDSLAEKGDTAQVRESLGLLRRMLEAALAQAESLEEALDGLAKLDPDTPGGGTVHPKGRGRPPGLLTVYVKDLLLQRFPEWDGSPPFPESNTQELREWLRDELTAPTHIGGGTEGAFEALFPFGPFDPERVDPAPKGPLYRIVSNLQRLQ